MTQEEKRRFLIGELLKEAPSYRNLAVPDDAGDQRALLRGLMNVREPGAISPRFLAVQDAYLAEELARRGVVDGASLPPVPLDSRISLWQGDITTLKVDAIVNAANSGMTGCYLPNHRCIDNCIHTFAGVQLRLECAGQMARQGRPEPTGLARLTPGYNLPCRYVLHTVGPIVTGRLTRRDCELLASCYRSCLALAAERGLESVAFCCISTGEFHFPNDRAAEIAVQTVQDFLCQETQVRKVIFNVFKDADKEIYERLLG